MFERRLLVGRLDLDLARPPSPAASLELRCVSALRRLAIVLCFDVSVQSGIRQVLLAATALESAPLVVVLRTPLMLLLLAALRVGAAFIHARVVIVVIT